MSEVQSGNDREEIEFSSDKFLKGRVGVFRIHRSWLFTSVYKEFMKTAVIVKAESTFEGQVMYVAFHPDFEVVEPGYEYPGHVVSVSRFGGGTYVDKRTPQLTRFNGRYYLDQPNPHGED